MIQLSGSAHNNQAFQWRPPLNKCFESIKQLAVKMPMLKLVNFSKNVPIWIITDGSRPAGFLSKKFSSMQHKYHMHEHETIVVLEVPVKWEDKHLGRKFTLTDHKGLKYFKTQPMLSLRQGRWWEYLSCFNFNTRHTDGKWNKVTNFLSCYSNTTQSRTNIPTMNTYVKINEWNPSRLWCWYLCYCGLA